MARMTPNDVQQQIDQQNADTYGDDNIGSTGGGADPMDIDDEIEKVTGNEPDDDIDIAKQINKDEKGLRSIAPVGADVGEEEQEEEDDELSSSGMHVVGPDGEDIEE
jgi:hypothetical protein